jgi:hypothetical protein
VISRKKLKKLEKNQLQCFFIHPNDSPTLSNLGMNTTLMAIQQLQYSQLKKI